MDGNVLAIIGIVITILFGVFSIIFSKRSENMRQKVGKNSKAIQARGDITIGTHDEPEAKDGK